MTNDALTRYSMASSNSDLVAPRGTELAYSWLEKNPMGAYCYSHEADLLISNLRAELEAERAKVLGLEKDAARYRWLRNDSEPAFCVVRYRKETAERVPLYDSSLDAAIDAALDEGERA
jgi:hypothetical protein